MCKFRGQIRNETNLQSFGVGRQRMGESPFPLASKKKREEGPLDCRLK